MFVFILLLLGSTHGAYLSYAIFSKNNTNNNANLVLALFVFCFSLNLSFILLDISGIQKNIPHTLLIDLPITFLYSPLLYIYVKKLTAIDFYQVKIKHFLPAIIVFMISIPFYLQGGEFKFNFIYGPEPLSTFPQWYRIIFEFIFDFIVAIQIALYLSNIHRHLKRHHAIINDNFSYTEKINLVWLVRLNIMVSILFVFFVLELVFEINSALCIDYGSGLFCAYPWTTAEPPFFFSEIGVVICIYMISIYGLKQPEIFDKFKNIYDERLESHTSKVIGESYLPQDKTSENKNPLPTKKYQNSSLTKELSLSVYQELCKFITERQLHLNTELSLPQLAELSGWSKHNLSQAINQCAGKNFFDFVNSLRVEHAKKLLVNSVDMSILDVSLEAGFNSRSAFYNAFKKHTRITPSEFRKQ
jgi:AraC-like DNA-binding protein